WLAPLGHSFIGLQGDRRAHNQEHGFTVSSSSLTNRTPRPTKSNRAGQKYIEGFLGRPKRDIPSSVTSLHTFPTLEVTDPSQTSIHSPQPVKPLKTTKSIPAAPSTPSTLTVSRNSSLATEAKQQKFARELFEQHGIRRPTGWFSDDEDLSLLGDRTAGHRRFCRICHVCSARTWSQTHCVSCNHRLCAKCVCEVPNTEGAHADFVHPPSHTLRLDETRARHRRNVYRKLKPEATGGEEPTTPPSTTAAVSPITDHIGSSQNIPSRPVRQNPFVVADKERRESTAESHAAELPASQESHYPACSHRHKDGLDHEVSSTRVECDNPICRATHEGHYPYRHSITCALHRSDEAGRSRASLKNSFVSDEGSVICVTGSRSSKEASRPLNIAHWHHYSGFHDSHHSHGITSGRAADEHKIVNEHPIPTISRGVADYTPDKTPIPKSRVVSPPSWLKTPRKEAGDAKSRLHHINPKDHRHLSNSPVVSSSETKGEHPKDLAYRFHLVRDSFGKLTRSSLDLLRMAAPSPPTAMHVTQHQKPESWLDHSSANVHSQASHKLSPHMIGTPSTSLRDDSPRVNHKTSSHHEHSHEQGHYPTHLQVEDARYLRNGFLSRSSARSNVLHSNQTSEKSSHTHQLVHQHSRAETVQPGTRYSSLRVDTPTIRENERSPLSFATCTTHSPLQPQAVIDINEGTASESDTSTLGVARDFVSSSDETSNIEIHRPSPISPPNHDCNWKDRYLALAAEIRLLKAELSTRASLRGTDIDYTGLGDESTINEDEDLGIQGVTIIMHLRGRDDLVINTDLTQDPDRYDAG
ncbi:hypothetical protein F4781DRAFT_88429, partial [Annulohypoxylon bovei var. microspora]